MKSLKAKNLEPKSDSIKILSVTPNHSLFDVKELFFNPIVITATFTFDNEEDLANSFYCKLFFLILFSKLGF